MRCKVIFLLLFAYQIVRAQKPPIDSAVFGKWPVINNVMISDDGNYSAYIIANKVTNTQQLTIRSNFGDWKMKFANASNVGFSPSSKSVFFTIGQDSLAQVVLGRDKINYLANVKSYQFYLAGKDEWLAIQRNTKDQELLLKNQATGKEETFPKTSSYFLAPDHKRMIIEMQTDPGENKRLSIYSFSNGVIIPMKDAVGYTFGQTGNDLLVEIISPDKPNQHELLWMDFKKGSVKTIWRGTRAGGFIFDQSDRQLAFIADNHLGKTIFHYQTGSKSAVDLLAGQNLQDYKVDSTSTLSFNQSGKTLLFQLVKKLHPANPNIQRHGFTGSPNLVLWSHTDPYLQSAWQTPISSNRDGETTVWAAVNTTDHHSFMLTTQKEELISIGEVGNYALVKADSLIGGGGIPFTYPLSSYYSISLENGKRTVVWEKQRKYVGWRDISPAKKFLFGFDYDSLCYYSYEFETNIHQKISMPQLAYDSTGYRNLGRKNPFGIAGWSANDEYVFIYDQYDIWKIDPRGIRLPVNITRGYGRKNQITFSFADGYPGDQKEILLTAYDNKNDYSGFWKLQPGKDPEKLTMERASYFTPRTGRLGIVEYDHGEKPIKAANANKYLVRRMTASSFPNYYFTTDFKTFTTVTDVHPEKAYNWLTSELIHWQLPDGSIQKGALYKPENFDLSKKYPLIFTYYERLSDEVNQFQYPDYCIGRIEIPYYASNGYLVFVPDIDYVQKENGNILLNTVLSAAKYLCKFPYVDSTRLGLQGHSFGGWATGYLVSHSHLFAAACAAAGIYDQFTDYGQLTYSGFNTRHYYEGNTIGLSYGEGITPWARPDLYMANSSLFSVQNITTPLMLMQGTKDGNVSFSQSIEMFLAMKRAGKKVWLLQYNNATHNLSLDVDTKDYTIRMKQFFDHYLKGAPPPKWMTVGVPYPDRQKDSGLALDNSGKQP